MSLCRASGCLANREGFGSYCDRHKRAYRRHGHPEQKGVSSFELEGIRRWLRTQLEAMKSPEAKDLLRAQWEDLRKQAGTQQASANAGNPYIGWQLQAYQKIARVAAEVDPMKGCIELLAVLILYQEDERRFKSHDALYTQLARRFLRLTDHHVGEWFNHQTQKVHRVYRDVSPRVLRFIGKVLLDSFAGAAGSFHRMYEQEITSRLERMKQLRELA